MTRKSKKKIRSPEGFRVALYIRVSTEEQAENPEGSIKNQEQRLREFLKLKNMIEPFGEVAEVFSDPGVSAKNMNRPGFQKMLKAIEAKTVDLVLVTELSRFSRSTRDFAMLQEFLEEHDCKFLSIRENFDTSGAAGKMVLNLMASIAEFERRQTGERISNSFQARAKRGLYNGGSVPLGYRIDEEKRGCLLIVPEEAETIRLIFKTFLREGSLAATAKWLNDEKVRYPREMRGGGKYRAKIFRIDLLYRILRNKSYIGIRTFRVKDGTNEALASWPAIIDVDTFERAGVMLTDNCSRRKTHGGNKFPFILTGLLSCEECGERMAGASATSNSGHRVGYYEHTATRKNEASLGHKVLKHSPRRIPVVKIEPVVWAETKRFILEDGFVKDLLERARAINGSIEKDSKRKDLRAKETALERQVSVLAERIGKLPESINAEPLIEQLGELQDSQKKIQEEIGKSARETAETDSPANFDSLESFRKGLRELIKKGEVEPAIKSAIIKQVVHKILIQKDGFEIHFHVGQNYVVSALGHRPGASFFVPLTTTKQKPSPGVTEEGSFLLTATEASRIFKVSGSRRLKIGGLCKTRTCDLSHVKGTRYQLRQQTNSPDLTIRALKLQN